MTAVNASDRRALRRQLREARRALSARQQYDAAHALLAELQVRPEVRRARRVAVYLPQDGEIDPGPLSAWLQARGCLVCLPVIDPIARGSQRLRFAPWDPDISWQTNRFGIDEPATPRALEPWTLDLVFLPLVGFDIMGNRLGMGGGFYDRTFDHRRPRAHRPRLIGLAHSLQQVDVLPRADHDVPLNAIATDQDFLTVAPTQTAKQRG